MFIAFWPIVDPSIPVPDLVREAKRTLPRIAGQAHARLTGDGRWSIRPSTAVPGSGRVTETVLFYEAPAEQLVPRTYWRTTRSVA